MVSNSGITITSARARLPRAVPQARFFLQHQHFQQVGHVFGVRDDVVADRAFAVALADLARGAKTASSLCATPVVACATQGAALPAAQQHLARRFVERA